MWNPLKYLKDNNKTFLISVFLNIFQNIESKPSNWGNVKIKAKKVKNTNFKQKRADSCDGATTSTSYTSFHSPKATKLKLSVTDCSRLEKRCISLLLQQSCEHMGATLEENYMFKYQKKEEKQTNKKLKKKSTDNFQQGF